MNHVTDNLVVADIQSVRERPTQQFDRVVTVCQDSVEDNVGCAYDWFNMSDGHGEYGGDASFELFAEAVDTVVAALEAGEHVCVHCHAGQSRSVAVATAALTVTSDRSTAEAYDAVERVRPTANPNPRLRGHINQYVEAADG